MAASGPGAPGEGRRRTGSSETGRQGGYASVHDKVAEVDELNSAVEARARAVGLERGGGREGGRHRTGVSETKQGCTTATTIQEAIQGTMVTAVLPGRGTVAGRWSTGPERPGDWIIQAGWSKSLWRHTPGLGRQECGCRPQEKGVYERRQATESPGHTERSRAERRRPSGLEHPGKAGTQPRGVRDRARTRT